ncbi:MAG TPA: hypothetical protein VLA96_00135, partial [Terriglobales bacterium]|nr:hypothetical protein [Terriglobales bacterium]
MTQAHPASEAWAQWWQRLDTLKVTISRLPAKLLVSSASARGEARELVQFYFRQVRPQLEAMGIEAARIDEIDQKMQHMIELTAGPNRKSTYLG